jgi:hypothetical protein
LIKFLYNSLTKHFILKFITGIFFVLSSTLFIPVSKEYTSLFITFEWIIAIAGLLFLRKILYFAELKTPILVLWFATGLFWFITSYNTPPGIWFWGFVPFLNWASLAWILLAAIGFLVSSNGTYSLFDTHKNENLYKTVKILSHIIVCIFLAFQVDNIWQQYGIIKLQKDIFISLVWTIYSLILLARGLYNKQEIYRNFSLFVLMVSCLKAFFIDLFHANSFYKMIFLFVFGLITITMSRLNKKWTDIEVHSNCNLNK